MWLWALIASLIFVLSADAGITFQKQVLTPEKDLAMVTAYGFRSMNEAKEFGLRYAGNKEIIEKLETERDRLSDEINLLIRYYKDPRDYHKRDMKRIHRIGMQIMLYSVAIYQANTSKPGAGVYIGCVPIK